MSVVTFELKGDHIKLLRNLDFALYMGGNKYNPPFVDEESEILMNIYDEIDLILNGKTDSLVDEPNIYSPEQKKEWDILLQELPFALDVILYTGKFEAGIYKTKYHVKSWTKAAHAV